MPREFGNQIQFRAARPFFVDRADDEERGFPMSLKSVLKVLALTLPFSFAASSVLAASGDDSYSGRYDNDSSYEANDYADEADEYRPRDWMVAGVRTILTPDAVRRRLRDSDYSNVHRITYVGGYYTASAEGYDGRAVTLTINATSGEVVRLNGKSIREASWRGERPTFTRATRRIESGTGPLTRGDVREDLLREGYTDLGWLREVGNVFICNARDSGGSRVELTVDAFTGQVIDTDYES
jgi:hypothetical protein